MWIKLIIKIRWCDKLTYLDLNVVAILHITYLWSTRTNHLTGHTEINVNDGVWAVFGIEAPTTVIVFTGSLNLAIIRAVRSIVWWSRPIIAVFAAVIITAIIVSRRLTIHIRGTVEIGIVYHGCWLIVAVPIYIVPILFHVCYFWICLQMWIADEILGV